MEFISFSDKMQILLIGAKQSCRYRGRGAVQYVLYVLVVHTHTTFASSLSASTRVLKMDFDTLATDRDKCVSSKFCSGVKEAEENNKV